MTHVLDTDHVSILERQAGADYAVVVAHLSLHSQQDVGITVISFHEQALGCHNYIQQAKTTADQARGYRMLFRVIDQFRRFPIAPFDGLATAAYDSLKGQKIRIGTLDLRIAAIALSRNLTVVSRNARDFGRVPGLRIEDWTR